MANYYVEVLELDDNCVTTECENIGDVLCVVGQTVEGDIVTVFDSEWVEISGWQMAEDMTNVMEISDESHYSFID